MLAIARSLCIVFNLFGIFNSQADRKSQSGHFFFRISEQMKFLPQPTQPGPPRWNRGWSSPSPSARIIGTNKKEKKLRSRPARGPTPHKKPWDWTCIEEGVLHISTLPRDPKEPTSSPAAEAGLRLEPCQWQWRPASGRAGATRRSIRCEGAGRHMPMMCYPAHASCALGGILTGRPHEWTECSAHCSVRRALAGVP